MLRWAGWRVVLAQPVPSRCVVVFYPHTSNWDFPIGLMAKWMLGIHFRFIAKDSLFATPLAPDPSVVFAHQLPHEVHKCLIKQCG